MAEMWNKSRSQPFLPQFQTGIHLGDQRTEMTENFALSRRRLLSLGGLAGLATLAGCASAGPRATLRPAVLRDPEYDFIYREMVDGDYVVPAVPYNRIPERFLRQRVVDPTGQPQGTVVVDTAARHLYVVEGDGMAMRYGVGIGREGFAWDGEGVIQWRKKWPKWTPPDEMVARQPELVQYSAANGGMEPGLTNPLGARALYIFKDGQDTLYRLHGSPEWNSIGKAVSSGCVRLINQDVIDLYDRVPNKARIVVM